MIAAVALAASLALGILSSVRLFMLAGQSAGESCRITRKDNA